MEAHILQSSERELHVHEGFLESHLLLIFLMFAEVPSSPATWINAL